MKSKQHPSDEQLLSLCGISDVQTGHPDQQEARAHVDAGCRQCGARVEAYAAILRAMRAPGLAEVPAPMIEAALERIREQGGATAPGSLLSAVSREVAERIRRVGQEIRMGLALDTGFGAALAGIRSVGSMTPRQLLYESPLGTLHLQIMDRGDGKADILGQFLFEGAPAERPAEMDLESAGKTVRARLSPTGEFRFEGIARGAVRLSTRTGDTRLVVDVLESAPPSSAS